MQEQDKKKKRVLTEKDLDENPRLKDAGFKVGDEVEGLTTEDEGDEDGERPKDPPHNG